MGEAATIPSWSEIEQSQAYTGSDPSAQTQMKTDYFRRFGKQAAEQEAAKIGLAPGLATVTSQVESAGNPTVMGPKLKNRSERATGMFQVLPSTGREQGYDVTDPAQNVQIGPRYLKQMIDHFGDTAMGLSAYNAGPGRLQRALDTARRTGQPWTNFIPGETREYLRRVAGLIQKGVHLSHAAPTARYPLPLAQESPTSPVQIAEQQDVNTIPVPPDLGEPAPEEEGPIPAAATGEKPSSSLTQGGLLGAAFPVNPDLPEGGPLPLRMGLTTPLPKEGPLGVVQLAGAAPSLPPSLQAEPEPSLAVRAYRSIFGEDHPLGIPPLPVPGSLPGHEIQPLPGPTTGGLAATPLVLAAAEHPWLTGAAVTATEAARRGLGAGGEAVGRRMAGELGASRGRALGEAAPLAILGALGLRGAPRTPEVVIPEVYPPRVRPPSPSPEAPPLDITPSQAIPTPAPPPLEPARPVAASEAAPPAVSEAAPVVPVPPPAPPGVPPLPRGIPVTGEQPPTEQQYPRGTILPSRGIPAVSTKASVEEPPPVLQAEHLIAPPPSPLMGEISPADIRTLAAQKGVESDAEKNPAFAAWSKTLTGESHLDRMASPQLETMRTALERGEAPRGEYAYASTQMNLPAQMAEKVKALSAQIAEGDLVGQGREEEPHITVKYGLHGNDPEVVRALLADEPPVQVQLGATSIFPPSDGSEGGAVVKIDIVSPDLQRLNRKITEALPNTTTQPTYKPHITLAYVKPTAAHKYIGHADLVGQTLTFDHVVFSDQEGKKTNIQLGGKVASAKERTTPPPLPRLIETGKYYPTKKAAREAAEIADGTAVYDKGRWTVLAPAEAPAVPAGEMVSPPPPHPTGRPAGEIFPPAGARQKRVSKERLRQILTPPEGETPTGKAEPAPPALPAQPETNLPQVKTQAKGETAGVGTLEGEGKVAAASPIELNVNFPVASRTAQQLRETLFDPVIGDIGHHLGIREVRIDPPHTYDLSQQGAVTDGGSVRLSPHAEDPTHTLLHEFAHLAYDRMSPEQQKQVSDLVQQNKQALQEHSPGYWDLAQRGDPTEAFATLLGLKVPKAIELVKSVPALSSPASSSALPDRLPNEPAVPAQQRVVPWRALEGGNLTDAYDIGQMVEKYGDHMVTIKDVNGGRHRIRASQAASLLKDPIIDGYVREVIVPNRPLSDSTLDLTTLQALPDLAVAIGKKDPSFLPQLQSIPEVREATKAKISAPPPIENPKITDQQSTPSPIIQSLQKVMAGESSLSKGARETLRKAVGPSTEGKPTKNLSDQELAKAYAAKIEAGEPNAVTSPTRPPEMAPAPPPILPEASAIEPPGGNGQPGGAPGAIVSPAPRAPGGAAGGGTVSSQEEARPVRPTRRSRALAPAATDVRLSIVIKNMGGIAPPQGLTGEARSLTSTKEGSRLPPGVFRRGGNAFDDPTFLSQLEQAGFNIKIPEELLAALEQEAAGKPVYPQTGQQTIKQAEAAMQEEEVARAESDRSAIASFATEKKLTTITDVLEQAMAEGDREVIEAIDNVGSEFLDENLTAVTLPSIEQTQAGKQYVMPGTPGREMPNVPIKAKGPNKGTEGLELFRSPHEIAQEKAQGELLSAGKPLSFSEKRERQYTKEHVKKRP